MKPRIAIHADRQTRDEISQIIDREHFEIVSDDPLIADVDAVLTVGPVPDIPSEHLAASQSRLWTSLNIYPEASSSAFPMVPVPNVSVFLELAKVRARSRFTESEAKLRRETMTRLNAFDTQSRAGLTQNERILFLGEPSGTYLRCVNELKKSGRQIDAVLTEHSAFEHLRSYRPQAFIFTASPGELPVELLDHIHGRADLKSLPVIAIVSASEVIAEISDRVSSFVLMGPDNTRAIEKILTALVSDPDHIPLQRPSPGSPLLDRYSGVFNRDFAEHHLKSQLASALRCRRAHTVALISPLNLASGKSLDPSFLAHFASSISASLRQEDFLARLDWQNFLISFPECTAAQAQVILQRAQNVMESTELGRHIPTMSFRESVSTLSPHHAPDTFWRLIEAFLLPGHSDHHAAVA